MTNKIKFKLINYTLLNSTNKKIKSLLKKNSKLNNLCVTADNQTHSYGRRNSKWHSYIGNLHLSILIKPNCLVSKINHPIF